MLYEGGGARLSWPNVEISRARVPRAPRDLVLLTGPSPAGVAHVLAAIMSSPRPRSMVVTVALYCDVPHSRPVLDHA